jgi:hypothetical protein
MDILRETLRARLANGAGPADDDILNPDPIERRECR